MAEVVSIGGGAPEFRPRSVTLPGDIPTLCRQFLKQMGLRGYARNTVRAYCSDLERLAGFLIARDKVLVQSVSTMDLDDFIDALLQGEGLSPRSVARKRTSVKAFFNYVERRGLVSPQANPARQMGLVRFETGRAVAPEESEILRLIDSIPQDSAAGVRDRALFRLMFDGALRISAVLGLDVYVPDRPPRHTVTPAGVVYYLCKGGRTEETVVDDVTLAMLRRWLDVRHRFGRYVESPALFLSQKGGRITRQAVHARLKSYGRRIGMQDIHAHLLRHRRLGDVLDRSGLPLAHYLSGHKQMSTTANIYGAQSHARLRERVRRECPVGKGVA